jgi:RNA polymerase sigma factor (sigma-70 family)
MPKGAGRAEPRDGLFVSTRWTLVLEAGAKSTNTAQRALEELCRIYWPAIYAYIRRRGYAIEDAQDLTQSFFQHLLEKETLQRASRDKGRFRSFLLGSLKLSLADEYHRRNALKRGGNVHFISVDQLEAEEIHQQRMTTQSLTPDELLDARWAGLLLERAIAGLRAEFTASGKVEIFETLSPFLAGEKAALSYESAAQRMKIGLGAVKSLIHRLRRQFAVSLRREIMQTVSAPHEVDDELRHLRMVFARAGEQQGL